MQIAPEIYLRVYICTANPRIQNGRGAVTIQQDLSKSHGVDLCDLFKPRPPKFFGGFLLLQIQTQRGEIIVSGRPFQPNDTDVRIGETICILRTKQGMSQKELARRIGVTFQQVQKYEVAGNRIAVSRLYDIARVLEVPVGTLFNEIEQDYAHDRNMRDIIKKIYKMKPSDREIVFSVVRRLAE